MREHDWRLMDQDLRQMYWKCRACGKEIGDEPDFSSCPGEGGNQMNEYNMVKQLYTKYGFTSGQDCEPHEVGMDVANYRLRAIREELIELTRAYEKNDLVEIADALVDLVVFAMGTAVLHDLPWDELFSEVHRSNMQKIAGAGIKERSAGQRDLIKPVGWRKPDVEGILRKHGWKDVP